MIKSILKKLRIFILLLFRYRFQKVGKGFYCGKNLYIKPGTVKVGDMVYLGNYCHLSAGDILIEDYSMLASYVSVIGGDHLYDKPGIPIIKNCRGKQEKVVIEKDVWVGHGTIIMHGVRIGEGSIIGAGSIITKDIPPYSIVAGNPTRIIKKRFKSDDERKYHSELINGNFSK